MKAEMKKILFVINTMGYGGAERALLNLISALEKEQYEISVFVLTGQGELIHQIPDSVTLLNKNYKDVSVLTSKGRMELMKTILIRINKKTLTARMIRAGIVTIYDFTEPFS